MTLGCARCRDQRWVCEDHPDRPWNGGEGCGGRTECCWFAPFRGFAPGECPYLDGCHDGRPCEMAGAPCPDCNDPGPGQEPADGDWFIPLTCCHPATPEGVSR